MLSGRLSAKRTLSTSCTTCAGPSEQWEFPTGPGHSRGAQTPRASPLLMTPPPGSHGHRRSGALGTVLQAASGTARLESEPTVTRGVLVAHRRVSCSRQGPPQGSGIYSGRCSFGFVKEVREVGDLVVLGTGGHRPSRRNRRHAAHGAGKPTGRPTRSARACAGAMKLALRHTPNFRGGRPHRVSSEAVPCTPAGTAGFGSAAP